jgi:hypothetical protein
VAEKRRRVKVGELDGEGMRVGEEVGRRFDRLKGLIN